MNNLKWLYENFGYVDSVTAVDHTGRITVKKRYNPRFSDEENQAHNEWAIGKSILEVFPSLNHEESSLLQTLTTGKIIYYENQEVWNNMGRKTTTNNITFPIISRGKIVGAIEISRDLTHIENRVKTAKLDFGAKKNRPNTGAKYVLNDIITEDPEMRSIKKTIEKIASSSSSVLVYGETGTGKELVVSALHNAGYRRTRPFIAVNCAALPESILEGLLFGSRKGAFTGAENKKGLFEEADGGTIYLDEINSMPVNLQAKLLRVLQEKTIMPLGEARTVEVDVRIIASTNKVPEEMLVQGEMRSDLLYRLNTISINIPPLRRRKADIHLLAAHFVDKYNEQFEKMIKGISKEADLFLEAYDWNGNVRELEHAVESAMNVAEDGGYLGVEHLPAYLTMREPQLKLLPSNESRQISLSESLKAYEKKMIVDALNICNWKIVDAARILKIPRTTLQSKMERYGLKG